MKYYHHFTKEEADEAQKLPNKVFQKTYSRPAQCGYYGALDKALGVFTFGLTTLLECLDSNLKIECERCGGSGFVKVRTE